MKKVATIISLIMICLTNLCYAQKTLTVLVRDPFAKTPVFNSAMDIQKQGLAQYSIFALKIVGVLQQQNKLWAVIIDPQAELYCLQVGNFLGLERAKIVQINDDGIVVSVETAGSLRHVMMKVI